jgi:hypothetical protein
LNCIKCAGRLLVAVLLLRLFGLEGVDALIASSGPSPRYAMGFAATPDGMLYVFGGGDSTGIEGWGVQLRWIGPVAWDAVLRRARAAPLLSLSLAEGTRVGREEMCRHMCTFAAGQWAVHVQLRKELAISSYALGGEIERRRCRSWPHIHTHAHAHTHMHVCS